MITVEDLIKKLENIEDKSKPVFFQIFDDDAEFVDVFEYKKIVRIEQLAY